MIIACRGLKVKVKAQANVVSLTLIEGISFWGILTADHLCCIFIILIFTISVFFCVTSMQLQVLMNFCVAVALQ